MTNREYITKSLSKFDVSTDEIDLIIIDNDLNESGLVDVTIAKQAICKSIGAWLPIHSSVSEGGVSVSWNFEAVKLYYSTLCQELGLSDVAVTSVRDRSNIW